jgi:hypothetical protein
LRHLAQQEQIQLEGFSRLFGDIPVLHSPLYQMQSDTQRGHVSIVSDSLGFCRERAMQKRPYLVLFNEIGQHFGASFSVIQVNKTLTDSQIIRLGKVLIELDQKAEDFVSEIQVLNNRHT